MLVTKTKNSVSLVTVRLIAMFALFVLVSGCGTVSTVALNGTYIESTTGQAFGLCFNSDGASLWMNLQMNPTTGRYQGTCICTGATYKLVGDTVRLEGGTLTPQGQMLTMFAPPSGGNVVLLNVADSGQSLDYTCRDGSILKYVRQ